MRISEFGNAAPLDSPEFPYRSAFHVPNSAVDRVTPLPDAAQTVTIPNTQGLHARPVMRFVDLAAQFQAEVWVKKGSRLVDGKNPMEMMLLEATKGSELEIQAEGTDAAPAVEALVKLVESGFGET
jgi:phosphocarrier protein